MKLLVQILDDNGEVLVEHSADPSQPSQWRAQPGQKLVSKMPQQSDSQNTGTYELCGFTLQPHVRIERPNGWSVPTPSPNNGQSIPPNFLPQNQNKYPFNPAKTWGPISPTPAPPNSRNIKG